MPDRSKLHPEQRLPSTQEIVVSSPVGAGQTGKVEADSWLESSEIPAALMAVTVTEYKVPLSKPVNTWDKAPDDHVHVPPSFERRTTYEVIGVPPV
jgi:hypothetical protein